MYETYFKCNLNKSEVLDLTVKEHLCIYGVSKPNVAKTGNIKN